MKKKTLQTTHTITGMWNGNVSFTALKGLVRTTIRVHVGLRDAQKIQDGASPDRVLADIIQKSQGYNDVKIVGVIADKTMKTANHPFKK